MRGKKRFSKYSTISIDENINALGRLSYYCTVVLVCTPLATGLTECRDDEFNLMTPLFRTLNRYSNYTLFDPVARRDSSDVVPTSNSKRRAYMDKK